MKENQDTPVEGGEPAVANGEPSPESQAQEPKVKPFTIRNVHDEAVEEPPAAAGDGADDEQDQRSKKHRKHGKKHPEEEALEMRLLRLQADFDNFRKRTLREKNELYTRANDDIMQELVPVLDHLELALKAAREHGAQQSLLDGFALVYEQLLSALKKFNLSVITAEGADFDPNRHEAISHIASPDVKEGGVIAQVRKGYMLGEQLLRPAQVVVSSGAPAK